MDKKTFLAKLQEGLQTLPQEELRERLSFYSEMIDDRMEDGLSEEEAVNQIGDLEEIIEQLPTPKKKAKRLKTSEIVLLIVGFPIWLPLLISAFAVELSLYVSYWSLIVSAWAVFASLAGAGLGGLVGGIVMAVTGESLPGIALIGMALASAGLSIFTFYGCKAFTNSAVWLTTKLVQWHKKLFTRKEEA